MEFSSKAKTESGGDCNEKIKVVLVLIAMEAEAKPFIEKLGLVDQANIVGPCMSYKGKVGDLEVVCVTNGKDIRHSVDNVGTTPAAISTYIAISTYKPCLIINAGTAGGFHRMGGNIGDVYICNNFSHHDRRIPIPGFEKYGIGGHETIAVANLISTLAYKSGSVTTSNSLDHNTQDDELMLANGAHVKDMESAAIAWVIENYFMTHWNEHHCLDVGSAVLPFFAVKVVTDIVDGSRPTHEEFLENLHTAASALHGALEKIIDYLKDKKLSDL